MSIPLDPEVITLLVAVNIAALLVLGVLSYFGSRLALDALAALDRRMMASQKKRTDQLAVNNVPRSDGGTGEDSPG
jgi:hypothetical protein